VTISFRGSRRAGRPVTVDVRAIDRESGSKTPQVFFGDGTMAYGRHLRHVYGRGRHTVTVRASDNAGNVRTAHRSIVIR